MQTNGMPIDSVDGKLPSTIKNIYFSYSGSSPSSTSKNVAVQDNVGEADAYYYEALPVERAVQMYATSGLAATIIQLIPSDAVTKLTFLSPRNEDNELGRNRRMRIEELFERLGSMRT